MQKTYSWEEEDGWKLLCKWFQSSCEISVSAGARPLETQFAMNKGLIIHLDPTRIRLRGEDGREFEMVFSEAPVFEDEWTAKMAASLPEVRRTFPEMVTVSCGWETWRFVGPIEIEGK
jgi:hypothetical protein